MEALLNKKKNFSYKILDYISTKILNFLEKKNNPNNLEEYTVFIYTKDNIVLFEYIYGIEELLSFLEKNTKIYLSDINKNDLKNNKELFFKKDYENNLYTISVKKT